MEWFPARYGRDLFNGYLLRVIHGRGTMFENLILKEPRRKNCTSGEHVGRSTSPFRETNRPRNVCRKTASEIRAVCALAPSCWNRTSPGVMFFRHYFQPALAENKFSIPKATACSRAERLGDRLTADSRARSRRFLPFRTDRVHVRSGYFQSFPIGRIRNLTVRDWFVACNAGV